ncbi:LamG domain-containing protein [Bacillus sp. PK3-056]|uniref:LamG-like jellyroll fold domain-containing protein n=1 Tax=Niallia circulans TaxID=1397 RepID=UPI000F446E52|nr:LamG-like jellyroll fold domain-containing protein [Niallia circulans]AYV74490.1 hypothetical protein C2H98_24610 [Niallia circulans]
MRKIVSLFLVFVLVVSFIFTEGSSHISATTENPSPIAEYNFDNDNGTTVTDSTGTFNGSAKGATLVDGWNGKARSFNGTNNYLEFNKKVIPVGEKSIKFMFKRDGIPKREFEVLLSNVSQGTEQYGFQVGITNREGGYLYVDGTSNGWGKLFSRLKTTSSDNIFDNKWHEILFSWDGKIGIGNARLYVDNKLVASSDSIAEEKNNQTYNLFIGVTPSLKHYFKGDLDQIEIYDKVINPKVEQPEKSTNKLYSSEKSFYKLTSDGEVYAWGENSYGQLGLGDTSKRTLSKKEKITLPEKITDISVGQNFIIALGESGKVYGWGDNASGVLSDDIGSIKSPVEVENEISEIISED